MRQLTVPCQQAALFVQAEPVFQLLEVNCSCKYGTFWMDGQVRRTNEDWNDRVQWTILSLRIAGKYCNASLARLSSRFIDKRTATSMPLTFSSLK